MHGLDKEKELKDRQEEDRREIVGMKNHQIHIQTASEVNNDNDNDKDDDNNDNNDDDDDDNDDNSLIIIIKIT